MKSLNGKLVLASVCVGLLVSVMATNAYAGDRDSRGGYDRVGHSQSDRVGYSHPDRGYRGDYDRPHYVVRDSGPVHREVVVVRPARTVVVRPACRPVGWGVGFYFGW